MKYFNDVVKHFNELNYENRINMMRKWDEIIRCEIGYEGDNLWHWLTYGLPDGWQEYELNEWAKDYEAYEDFLTAFCEAVEIAEAEGAF